MTGIKTNPTVLDMVRESLKSRGFDGLFNLNGECACLVSDLNPCSEMSAACEAGYRGRHEGFNFSIMREKPEAKP